MYWSHPARTVTHIDLRDPKVLGQVNAFLEHDERDSEMLNDGWELWLTEVDENDTEHGQAQEDEDEPQASTSNTQLVFKKKYVNHLTRRISTYEEEQQAVRSGSLSVESRMSSLLPLCHFLSGYWKLTDLSICRSRVRVCILDICRISPRALEYKCRRRTRGARVFSMVIHRFVPIFHSVLTVSNDRICFRPFDASSSR